MRPRHGSALPVVLQQPEASRIMQTPYRSETKQTNKNFWRDNIFAMIQYWPQSPQAFANISCNQWISFLNLQLKLVLDDSERIRHALQDYRPVLQEISAVCDMSTQEKKLDQNDQQVHKMQSKIVQPLEQLLQAVVVNNFSKRGVPQMSGGQVAVRRNSWGVLFSQCILVHSQKVFFSNRPDTSFWHW